MPDDNVPPEEVDEGPVILPFAVTLQQVQNGRFAADLAEKFHELITAVKDQVKGGSMTVKLDVGLLSKNDASTVTVAGTVTVKAPRAESPKTVLYLDKDNNLSTDDPQKQALPTLTRVEVAGGPLQKVGTAQ